MAIYFQYLSDYHLDAVRYAVDQAIKTGDRFPVVKTLREFANGYRPPRKTPPPLVQIDEFTQQQCLDARTEIQNLIKNLSGAACD